MGVFQHEPFLQLYKEMQEYQACEMKYKKVGWIIFLDKFNWFHDEVSRVFVHNFDWKMNKLGCFDTLVNEGSIIEEEWLS